MKIAKQTAKKILIILLIVFGSLALLGGTVFTIGMAAAGWDFSVMNTVDYVHKEYTEKQEVTKIELDFNTNDIKVYFDETATQVRVEYSEKYSKKGKQITQTTITEENGTLKVEQKYKFSVNLEFALGKSSFVNVYLPKSREYTLDIETNTGDIWLYGTATLTSLNIETDTGAIDLGKSTIVCSGDISLSTDTGNILTLTLTAENLYIEIDTGNVTLNGEVTIKKNAEIETDTGDVSASTAFSVGSGLYIETDTGDVYLGDISGEKLTVTTDTGNIKSVGLSLLDFTTLNFSTDTGDIILQLVGTHGEYSIQAHTNTGNNNLYDYPDKSKPRTLKIYTSTGNIIGVFPQDTIN